MHQMWSENVNYWSISTPRQVTTLSILMCELLKMNAVVSTLASWYRELRQVNWVSSLFSFNLLGDMQEPISLMHAVKCLNIMLQLSVLEWIYIWVSSAYEWALTPYRPAITRTSAVYNKKRIGPSIHCPEGRHRRLMSSSSTDHQHGPSAYAP